MDIISSRLMGISLGANQLDANKHIFGPKGFYDVVNLVAVVVAERSLYKTNIYTLINIRYFRKLASIIIFEFAIEMNKYTSIVSCIAINNLGFVGQIRGVRDLVQGN